jgi:hypothetical protein
VLRSFLLLRQHGVEWAEDPAPKSGPEPRD